MTRTVNRAFNAGTAAIDIAALERAFAANDRPAVEGLLLRAAGITNVTLRETWPADIVATLEDGANAAATAAMARGGLLNPEPIVQDVPPDPRIEAQDGDVAPRIIGAQEEGPPERVGPFVLDFDTTNAEASRWAREESSTRIVAIDAETRIAIQEIINDAFEKGLPPRVAAKQVIQLINLTPRPFGGGPAGPYSWQAVDNLRTEMENRVRGTLRRGGTFRNLPVPPGGFTAAEIDKVVGAYAKRLQQRRALNISRTETITASNEGQRQLWLQQVEAGNLNGNEKREWIVTPDQRLCPICAPMAGQLVGLKELFTTGDGSLVMGPTAHPSCRCAVALVAADAKPRRPPAATTDPFGVVDRQEDFGDFQSAAAKLRLRNFLRGGRRDMSRLRNNFEGLEDFQITTLRMQDSQFVTGFGPDTEGAIGMYQRAVDRIVIPLNGNRARVIDRVRFGGWGVNLSPRGALLHEAGHAAQLQLFDRNATRRWQRIFNNLERDARITTEVSEYAASSADELWAESFGAYTHPSYRAGTLPEEIENFLSEILPRAAR